jgi:putative ABC transport system permease protein
MTFQDQVSTALSNLGRRKMRTALASLGVVVGTLTIVIMVSLASGVRGQINRQFESIGLDRLTVRPPGERRGGFGPVENSGRTKIISPKDVARWREWPGVTKLTPEVNLPGSARLEIKANDLTQTVRLSGGEQRPGPPGMSFERPEAVAGSAEIPDEGGIVLSRGAALAIGISTNNFDRFVGQKIETVLRAPRGEMQSFTLQVKGISSEKSSSILLSAADRISMKNWWLNSTNIVEKEGYDSVTIRAADVSQAHAVTARLKKEGFQVQSLEMFVEVANRIVTAITVMLAMIGGVALLVASIGIANTMVMAIYERTREIGILKAMGASRGEIRQMFMVESGFIGAIGGVLGLLLGWALGFVLNHGITWYMQSREMPLRGDFFTVTLTLAAGAILFAAFIGIAAGLLPAQRAASLDPLTALRHE